MTAYLQAQIDETAGAENAEQAEAHALADSA